MNFKKNETQVKLRGGYYTPPLVAKYLTKWAVGEDTNTVLEPSCGDGVFIKMLQNINSNRLSITGIERDPIEAAKASQYARKDKHSVTQIVCDDFLRWSIDALSKGIKYDAIVGNPPYIRYQYLDEVDQKYSEQLFNQFGLHFTKHTNAWVPFVISCIGLLKPGGKLAMVVPAEILHVLHATSLRAYLIHECKLITIIDPVELLFDQALQGTILLLVQKKFNKQVISNGITVITALDNDFLLKDPILSYPISKYTVPINPYDKWMRFLLNEEERNVLDTLSNNSHVFKFNELAQVDVGVVTGANKFFLIDDETVKKYSLTKYVQAMYGRSEHCPGILYDINQHKKNAQLGYPTNFVNFNGYSLNDLSKSAKEYIKIGEKDLLHKRYKCRMRTPWFSVPSVYSSKLGMLKRSHNYPRLIFNKANALTTDTAYRIKLKKNVSAELLAYTFINSLTALTAELEGRHYGGGVLELVPSEIEKLLIPIPPGLKPNISSLNKDIIESVNPDDLIKRQDNVVLLKVGANRNEIAILQKAWRKIRYRRHRLIDHELDKRDNYDA